jgi:hypothetical protein
MITLPIELVNKILLYNIHPVAEIIKKHNDPMTKLVTVLKLLKKEHEYVCAQFNIDVPDHGMDLCDFATYYMCFSHLNPWKHHNFF